MLLFAMRNDDRYAQELADAKAVRDDAEGGVAPGRGEDAGGEVAAPIDIASARSSISPVEAQGDLSRQEVEHGGNGQAVCAVAG